MNGQPMTPQHVFEATLFLIYLQIYENFSINCPHSQNKSSIFLVYFKPGDLANIFFFNSSYGVFDEATRSWMIQQLQNILPPPHRHNMIYDEM